METNRRSDSIRINTGKRLLYTNVIVNSSVTNTGDHSAAINTGKRLLYTNVIVNSSVTNTGDHSAAINTDDNSATINTGENSVAINTGENSIACALGVDGKVKACKGSAIVLVERGEFEDIINIKAAIVDGEILKENTYYMLVNGEFKEVK